MSKHKLRMALVGGVIVAMVAPLVGPMLKAQDQPAQPQQQPAAAPATDPAAQVDPNQAVITVGDEKITAAEFQAFVDDLPPQYQQMAQGPGKRMLAEELVKLKLLAGEAEKRGLADSPKVKRQMEMMKDQVLAASLAEQLQSAGGDDELQKYYDEHKGEFEQVKARHILIRGENSPIPAEEGKPEMTDEQAKAKADDIRKQLDGGADFATLAKAESVDKGSGAKGGDLGTFGRGQMVPEFEAAAFGMKEGEVSQPVKTQFGYHIIQVQERKTAPFAEVKDQLTAKLGPERMEALIKELREKNKTELNEQFFGPAMPQMPMP